MSDKTFIVQRRIGGVGTSYDYEWLNVAAPIANAVETLLDSTSTTNTRTVRLMFDDGSFYEFRKVPKPLTDKEKLTTIRAILAGHTRAGSSDDRTKEKLAEIREVLDDA